MNNYLGSAEKFKNASKLFKKMEKFFSNQAGK